MGGGLVLSQIRLILADDLFFCWFIGRNPDANAVERDELILDKVIEDPNLSIRGINRDVVISTWTVWNLLHHENLHPYHYNRVQALRPDDYERRMNFCRWLLHRNKENENLIENILFTVE